MHTCVYACLICNATPAKLACAHVCVCMSDLQLEPNTCTCVHACVSACLQVYVVACLVFSLLCILQEYLAWLALHVCMALCMCVCLPCIAGNSSRIGLCVHVRARVCLVCVLLATQTQLACTCVRACVHTCMQACMYDL